MKVTRGVELYRAVCIDKAQNVWREAFPFEIKASTDPTVVDIIGSTEDVDRDGDVVEMSGWELAPFKQNPVILWGHQYHVPAIGRAERVARSDGKLRFRVKFVDEEDYPFAGLINRLVNGGFIRAASVGFIPKKYENMEQEAGDASPWTRVPKRFQKQELLELSFVNVGSNRNALTEREIQEAMQKGIITEEDVEQWNALADLSKTVVPYRRYPLIAEGTAWDAARARTRLLRWAGGPGEDTDWAKYGKGFGYYDPEKRNTIGGYKFPHHDVVNGAIQTHWRGVVAAMGALLGARTGADVPDGERRGIYGHLERHYADFDKPAPEFRDVGIDGHARILIDGGFEEREIAALLQLSYCPGDAPITVHDLETVAATLQRSLNDTIDKIREDVQGAQVLSRSLATDLQASIETLEDSFAEWRETKPPQDGADGPLLNAETFASLKGVVEETEGSIADPTEGQN